MDNWIRREYRLVKQRMFSLVVQSVEIRRVWRLRPAAGVSIRGLPHCEPQTTPAERALDAGQRRQGLPHGGIALSATPGPTGPRTASAGLSSLRPCGRRNLSKRSARDRLVSAASRKWHGDDSVLFASRRFINQPILRPLNQFRSSNDGARNELTKNRGSSMLFVYLDAQAGCLGNSTSQPLKGSPRVPLDNRA